LGANSSSGGKGTKKTLGYFLRELRENTPIRKDFDKILSDFLTARNTFVHKLSSIPDFSLKDEAGIKAGLNFVRTVNKQAVHIRNVLLALTRLMMGKGVLKEGIGPEISEEEDHELMAIGVFLQSDFWED